LQTLSLRSASTDERGAAVLTPEALGFVESLHAEFDGERRRLLARRTERQVAFDGGETAASRSPVRSTAR
jgi:malate synthase